jgi:hypothetical protein
MIAPTQIRKPENWQDFEKLCKKLWGEIWDCPDTIQRNGRSGQNQNGVDVYGLPKNETAYYGIQCKGKDDYSDTRLTINEIECEIRRALNFKPKLKRFIFATTANKDVSVEEYIRNKNLEHIQKGFFEVYISSWEDIVDLLEERRDTYNWYINNCQYKDLSDIEVFIDERKEHDIYPQYFRTTKTYSMKDNDPYVSMYQAIFDQYRISEVSRPLFNPLNPPRKINYTWCTIPINIKNTGNTVIEDYKLCLHFEHDKIEDLDDKFRYLNEPLMNQAALAQLNASEEAKREVFESSEYFNVIEYLPLNRILVQDDSRRFKIGVKPKQNVDKIEIYWSVKARNYQKEGILYLNVKPKYEEKTKNIIVDNIKDLKETEIIIEPKIIEK